LIELAAKSIPFNAPAMRDPGFSDGASGIGMLALSFSVFEILWPSAS